MDQGMRRERHTETTLDLCGDDRIAGFQPARSIESSFVTRFKPDAAGVESTPIGGLDRTSMGVSDIETWANLALADDVTGLAERLRLTLSAEQDLPRVFEGILGPVADLLGRWGDERRISFEEVDRSIRTLQDVISKFKSDPMPQATRGWRVGSILLASFPGDQHSFGLRLVEEVFRRDGWSVTMLPAPNASMLVSEVSRNHFYVLGLSLGGAHTIADAPALLSQIRQEALNPDLRILLGGPALLAASNDQLNALGADYLALEGMPKMEAIRALLPD
jgi:MerR family transcriptional regulator, light-induced transcriptional regulator